MDEKMVQDSLSRDAACPSETRVPARTNLYLAASLLAAGVSYPVRVRDLSPTGARVETAIVPEVGTEAKLVRGRLGIACMVTWSADHFCGLRFTAPISVLEWMTHRVAQERRRHDDLALPSGGGGAGVRLEAEKAARVARDLARVSRLLDALGEALAGDPHVVARHSIRLHTLGLAMQTLAALSETIQGSGGGAGALGAADRGQRRA